MRVFFIVCMRFDYFMFILIIFSVSLIFFTSPPPKCVRERRVSKRVRERQKKRESEKETEERSEVRKQQGVYITICKNK